jgi:hypothetical protein
MKRSLRRPLAGGASGFTGADYLISVTAWQVGNFRRMYCAFHGVIQAKPLPDKNFLKYYMLYEISGTGSLSLAKMGDLGREPTKGAFNDGL